MTDDDEYQPLPALPVVIATDPEVEAKLYDECRDALCTIKENMPYLSAERRLDIMHTAANSYGCCRYCGVIGCWGQCRPAPIRAQIATPQPPPKTDRLRRLLDVIYRALKGRA